MINKSSTKKTAFLYQMLDYDGMRVGLLQTTLDYNIIKKEWIEYCKKSNDIDGFISFLDKNYETSFNKRIYVDDEIDPFKRE